jgi:hypothetical protein
VKALLSFALLLLMLLVTIAGATTINVPANQPTIAAAIAAATAGDTIKIAVGTYTENVTVNKHLIIIGGGSGSNPLSNTIIRKSTASPIITIAASGVSTSDPLLFKDLRVEPVNCHGFDIASGSVSYVKFVNVQVIGTNEHNDTESEMGLCIATTASLSYLDISNSAFDHLTYGWYFFKHGDWGPGGSMVGDVTVSNTSFSYNDAKGIYAEKLTNASFTGCTVTGNGVNTAFYNARWNGGFDINLKGQETYQNLSFTNMTVSNNGLGVRDGAGFMIKGRTDGGTYSLHPATLTGVTIAGGSYAGNERGIRFGEPGTTTNYPSGVVIHGADICNNVKTYSGTDGTAYGDVINFTPYLVNAEANWWCSISYATILSHVYGSVDFDPWCSDATHTNCTLTNPPMVVWVDDSWSGSSPGDIVGGHIFGYDAFSTIATGLAAVGATGTVNVLAGTYAENLTITKAVSLLGVGESSVTLYPALSAPNPPPGGGSLPAGASNMILVQSSDVTVSGMKLDGDNPGLTSGLIRGGADLDARNGIITNHLLSIVYNNLTVHDCTIKNIYLRGVYASSGGTFWFHHNTVQNVRGESASIGMFNFYGSGKFEYNTVSDCNDAISSNWSSGCEFLYNTVSNSGSGIHTDNAGSAVGSVADLIKGNAISNSSTNGYGIFTFAPYIAPVVTENTITNCDVGLTCAGSYAAVTPQFTNNVVNGMNKPGSTGAYITTQIWGYTSGNCSVNMTGNQIINNADGFYIEADSAFTCTVTAQNNNISGNTNTGVTKAVGAQGMGTFVLSLTANWWGAVNGPLQAATNPAGTGNSVDNGVKYSPWVASSASDYDGGTVGWQPDLHAVGVSTNGTIQEGVNLVAGSTVYIAAGTYAGQVVMSGFANLNLIGAGVGSTVVQATASMPHYFMTGSNKNFAILSVENSAVVKISHLSVNGLGLGNSNLRFVGIGYRNSGGSVDTCSVIDVRDTPFSGAQHGVGIYAFDDNGTNRTLVVRGTSVTGFQKTGIALMGVNLAATVDHSIVTGAGPTTVTAQNGIQIGPDASGTVSYNSVSNVSYTGPDWAASGLLAWGPGTVNADHNVVNECHASAYWTDGGGTVSNNTFTQTPAGTGRQEFYGFLGVHGTAGAAAAKFKPAAFDQELSTVRHIGATASPQLHTVVVNNNIMDGAGADTSFGIYEYAYGSGNVSFSASGNHVGNYYVGVELYNAAAALSSVINSNIILRNDYGLDNNDGGVSAQYNVFANGLNAGDTKTGNYYNQNCWDDYSGVGAYSISGAGGNMDNNPNTDCGLNMTPDTVHYSCTGNFDMTYSVGDIVQALDFIRVKLEFPAELTPGVPVVLNANYSLLPTPPPTTHGAGQLDTMQVDMIVLSGSQDGPASLFKIPFSATTAPASPSQIVEIDHLLRDSTNATILVPPAAPTVLLTDCNDPLIVVNSPASGGYYSVAPVLNLTATDDQNLATVYYQIDACTPGGWQVLVGSLSGTSYNNPSWPIPDFGTLTEALHCVHFKVVDQYGRANGDSCGSSWCFTKDITPPVPPTAFVAKPGHNKVHLTWTNSSSADVVGVKIQRVPWTDYPDYGSQPTPTAAPAYPATYATGTNVFDSAATTSSSVAHVDINGLTNASRDIYYYGAFAYDAAGNYSVAAGTAEGRSTSYWLGDIADNFISYGTFDGKVYFQDLNFFSLTYGKKQADAGFIAHADIGPTHNFSPKGIPMPDDSVNFEDAIIFAINFDAVSPSGKVAPVFADGSINGSLALSVVSDADGAYHLRLENNAGDVKGIHAVLELGPNTAVKAAGISTVVKGSTPPFFTWIGTQDHKVVVDVAILGQETTIGGSGDLATFELTTLDGARPQIMLTEGVIRDIENQTLSASLNSPITSIPHEYSLAQNYPNPFNPTTTISFTIPNAGKVKIEVFNVLGQRVAVLLDDYREAGSYAIDWKSQDDAGRSVASGVYLYRLTAGEYTSTRKMMLMK